MKEGKSQTDAQRASQLLHSVGRSWDSPEAIARRTGHDVEKVRAWLAGLQRLIESIESQQPRPTARRSALKNLLRAELSREVKARAAELKQCGVRNPVAQAEQEIAEREGFANGPAFNRWLRRNR